MNDREKRIAMLEAMDSRMDVRTQSLVGDPLVRRILMRPAPGQAEQMARKGRPIPDEEPLPDPVEGGFRLSDMKLRA